MVQPMKLYFRLITFTIVFYFVATELNAQNAMFENPQFEFEYIRTIGYSSTGGSDINECILTASAIEEGNYESWYTEWNKTATRLEKLANEFLEKGHTISAKEAWLRASGYYRTAEFFLHGNPEDERIVKTWQKSRDCFQKAMQYNKYPVFYKRIPFENTSLPAYLCLVDSSDVQRPLLIIHSGFDGTAEELYFEVAHLALGRGYNCLLFEGPGQGEMIRIQHMPFRPDWENVVKPVVDFALNLPQTDPERLALTGISFGGYLAPRAAAFEEKIKVCIANGGIYDFYENVIKQCPPSTEDMIYDTVAAKEFDKNIEEGIKAGKINGWVFENGMFTFHATSPSNFIRKLRPYSMKDYAGKIKCKMLVLDSENDDQLPGQAKQLYEALNCPKDYMLFTEEEGAGLHCQMGAIMISGERILNWLDENL